MNTNIQLPTGFTDIQYSAPRIEWSIDRTPSPITIDEEIDIETFGEPNDIFSLVQSVFGGPRPSSIQYFGHPGIQPVQPILYKCIPFQLTEEDKNCCICMETKEEIQICVLNCSHNFCVQCINAHIINNRQCPLCRNLITEINTKKIDN